MMYDPNHTFQPIHITARRLGLPEGWLKRAAKEGRIPSLNVGNNRFFCNLEAVEKALLDQKRMESSVEEEEMRQKSAKEGSK